jgi:hypothetical protein
MRNPMSEPTPNIPLLRKAVEWAEAEAAKPYELCEWNQATWARAAYDLQGKSPECGTCYCVAGYVASQIGDVPKSGAAIVNLSPGHSDTVPNVAKEALGLTQRQAAALFMAGNTIEDVRQIAEKIAGERL